MSILNKIKSGDLCGESSLQGDVLGSFDTLKSGVTDSVTGTIGNPSDITSAIEGNLTSLKTSVTSMLPELPDAPNINFQSELKSLQNLQVGSAGYLNKVATLKSQFGSLVDRHPAFAMAAAKKMGRDHDDRYAYRHPFVQCGQQEGLGPTT